MNVLLVNDTSCSPNTGCQATMFMINNIIEKLFSNNIIRRIPLKTINRKFSKNEKDLFFPSSCQNLHQAARKLLKAKVPDLSEIVENIYWADCVIINGEGSVLEVQNNAILIYLICACCHELRKECHLINFTAHITRPESKELAIEAFSYCATVSVREPLSYYFVKTLKKDVKLFPDIVIGMNNFISGDRVNCQKNAVLIGGGSATLRMNSPLSIKSPISFLEIKLFRRQQKTLFDRLKHRLNKLIKLLKKDSIPIILVGWYRDEWLEKISFQNSIMYIHPDFKEYYYLAKNTALNVTGRHHGCVLSASAKQKFITSTANCFKNYGNVWLYGSPMGVFPFEDIPVMDLRKNILNFINSPKWISSYSCERLDVIRSFYDGAFKNILSSVPDLISSNVICASAIPPGFNLKLNAVP